MGLAIGATVVAIAMTPWGKQSGGHFNPALTFAFYRLGNVELWDAIFYATAQSLARLEARASPDTCYGEPWVNTLCGTQ